jgi:HEPN domain-containing protein
VALYFTVEKLVKEILKELKKANRRLSNIEELLGQLETETEEPEDDGERRLLDGSVCND